jgi:fumarylacetoacetase
MFPDATTDPARQSWLASANAAETDFPLQNLPYGVFQPEPGGASRIGVAIGDRILDLAAAAAAGLLPLDTRFAAAQPTLNALMAAGPEVWGSLRNRLSELLGGDTCPEGTRREVERCLIPRDRAVLLLPAAIGDYTDFYASRHHAANVGALFRPEQPLLPNYRWIPIGYHGRSSSIVVSGAPVRRPRGQRKPADAAAPVFAPSQGLDYEVELGAFVGPGNPPGTPIPVERAAGHLFGLVLLNDWSARDLQAWEYQPLGPFLAKNFATSLSPWVVTCDALAPFRVPAAPRPAGDPALLPYLHDTGDQAVGAFDLTLEVFLLTPAMRAAGREALCLSRGNFRDLYWTLAQLLAHHTSNGCNLRPGDLLGSGTVSGPEKTSAGCLLELTRGGAEPIVLPDGEKRAFLQDGDEVILRAHAVRAGARRIGFGECRGVVLPALGRSR